MFFWFQTAVGGPSQAHNAAVEALDLSCMAGERKGSSIDQIDRYNSLESIGIGSDPIGWWSTYAPASLEGVRWLALRYLSIPASSVPSESVFSSAGLTITDHRSTLSAENASILLMLRTNREYDFFHCLLLLCLFSLYCFVDC